MVLPPDLWLALLNRGAKADCGAVTIRKVCEMIRKKLTARVILAPSRERRIA
jgi:hypothetical protein